MTAFRSFDGFDVAYRLDGDGDPVLVVPGGPGRDADYLGSLGGLAARSGRAVVTMEPRGTGASVLPPDLPPVSARVLARDLDALREHLSFPRTDLLAHSAGCTVALMYAATHPERVGHLVLVTPATRVLGLEDSEAEWEAAITRRRHEPWFDEASAALAEIDATGFTPRLRQAMSPLLYGMWTKAAQTHAASDSVQRNLAAADAFWGDLPDPMKLREALGRVEAPVSILIGELDVAPGVGVATRLADVFRNARVVTQQGAGHFPWVDNPSSFTALLADCLSA